MAKDFSKSGIGSKNFDKVKRISNEKAEVPKIQIIDNDNLVDCPYNKEDVSFTADLESSIKDIGFCDVIDVTDFNMEQGVYMILSGHRRRKAGTNVGITSFPCIIRHFDNEKQMREFLLLSNNYRNTDQDPLLMCNRYNVWKALLIEEGVKNFLEVGAEKLGLSKSQASRYDAVGRTLPELQDLIREEVCGMSHITRIAQFTEDEQKEIYNIIVEASNNKTEHLSRDTVLKIIEGYREGKKSWAEIANLPRDSGLPLNPDYNSVNGLNSSSNVPSDNNRFSNEGWTGGNNSEDFDYNDTDVEENDKDNAEDNITDIDSFIDEEQNKKEKENPEITNGLSLNKQLRAIENLLCDSFSFNDIEVEETVIEKMKTVPTLILDELRHYLKGIGREDEFFNTIIPSIQVEIDGMKKLRKN